MIIAGVLSPGAVVMMVFHIGTGAVDISGLLAFQVLFAGVALVLLSFAKKMVASRIKDQIASLKAKI